MKITLKLQKKKKIAYVYIMYICFHTIHSILINSKI